jgi:hypothetical protein
MELDQLHHRILYMGVDYAILYELPMPLTMELAKGTWESCGEASVDDVRNATRELALEGYVGLYRHTEDGNVDLDGEAALQAIDEPRNWVRDPSGTHGVLTLWTTAEGREAYDATWEKFGGPERNARYRELSGDNEET